MASDVEDMHPPNKFGSRFRTYVLESTCTAAVETLEIYIYLSEFTCKLVNAGDIAAIELSHPQHPYDGMDHNGYNPKRIQ